MSDEKETKLSPDEVKQVAGGKPAAKELSPEELNKVTGGLKIDDIP
jgi:bacteriocin-like protein